MNVIWRNSAMSWKLSSRELVYEAKAWDKGALNARWTRHFSGGRYVHWPKGRSEPERGLVERRLHVCTGPLVKTAAVTFSHEDVFLAGLREVDTRCLPAHWPSPTSSLKTNPRFKRTQGKPAAPPRLPQTLPLNGVDNVKRHTSQELT